jgi:hypothetical protein
VEVTPDSFLVATNTQKLNTLVHGRVGVYQNADNLYPTVNRFFKSKNGDLYAVADEGLFEFKNKKFKSDSTMRANGVDPNMFSGMRGGDPSSMITLYKVNVDGDSRKIYMQKTGGYFRSHKIQSSDIYTFSLKKIREGYWVLIIDKPLPKDEYAFSLMPMMNASDMTNSHIVFAFGID